MKLVVMGLGYVGLPLVQEAVLAGHEVTGFDVNATRVSGLAAGQSHVDDLADADIADLLERGLQVTTHPGCLSEADVIVICVPTPLEVEGTPDLGAVESASAMIGDHLTAGALVVLESTTYPGTTEDIVRPLVEERSGLVAGTDFALAYSPERIDPGNRDFTLRTTPKVVGGLTPACNERAVAFYETVVDVVVPTTGTREAELSKLLENTYRHVNIALVNELAIFCADLGVDIWESIRAASTKPFGFAPFYPGPGVGGHCIPIDPNYLSFAVRSAGYQFRFVELAQEISSRMPAYVASRAQSSLNEARLAANGSKILLIGVSYKPDIADERESPARPLATHLQKLGAEVAFHDPHVATFETSTAPLERIDDLGTAVAWADLVILVQAHSSVVDAPELAAAARILDTRGVLTGSNVERL